MLLSCLLLGVRVFGQRGLLVGCGAPALCQSGVLCLGSPRVQLAYRLVLTCECDTVALWPSYGAVCVYVLRPATTHAAAQHGFTYLRCTVHALLPLLWLVCVAHALDDLHPPFSV